MTTTATDGTPQLSHPTGFCLTRMHERCPGSVARNAGRPHDRLVCPCGCHR